MSNTAQIEARLFSGARLIKTMDQDAATGATWAFEDGRPARADLCQKMADDGVIAPGEDGLFPGLGQTYRLAPYPKPLEVFVSERCGPDWIVAKRRTAKLKEEHRTVILPREFAAAEREWTARHRIAA